jgi:hypothetical protein
MDHSKIFVLLFPDVHMQQKEIVYIWLKGLYFTVSLIFTFLSKHN